MDMTITDELAAETLAADNTPEAQAELRAALVKQLAEVDAKLAAEKVAAKARAIASIKALMAERGITAVDLVDPDIKDSKSPRKGGSGKKVAPKYRDQATGETWSGRGLQPKWLKARLAGGAELEAFRVV